MGDQKQKNAKKERPKVFTDPSGVGHVRKTPMDAASLVIMGKGMAKTITPVSCSPWSGASGTVGSYDMEQAMKNKELGYW